MTAEGRGAAAPSTASRGVSDRLGGAGQMDVAHASKPSRPLDVVGDLMSLPSRWYIDRAEGVRNDLPWHLGPIAVTAVLIARSFGGE